MEFWVLVGLAVVLLVVYKVVHEVNKAKAPLRSLKRQAENKVKMSDPILRSDIQILDATNSDLLDEAIDLRRAQIEQGRDPEA